MMSFKHATWYTLFTDDLHKLGYQNVGNATQIIDYSANGEASDWMLQKRNIISMSPELGDTSKASEGFYYDLKTIKNVLRKDENAIQEFIEHNEPLIWFVDEVWAGKVFAGNSESKGQSQGSESTSEGAGSQISNFFGNLIDSVKKLFTHEDLEQSRAMKTHNRQFVPETFVRHQIKHQVQVEIESASKGHDSTPALPTLDNSGQSGNSQNKENEKQQDANVTDKNDDTKETGNVSEATVQESETEHKNQEVGNEESNKVKDSTSHKKKSHKKTSHKKNKKDSHKHLTTNNNNNESDKIKTINPSDLNQKDSENQIQTGDKVSKANNSDNDNLKLLDNLEENKPVSENEGSSTSQTSNDESKLENQTLTETIPNPDISSLSTDSQANKQNNSTELKDTPEKSTNANTLPETVSNPSDITSNNVANTPSENKLNTLPINPANSEEQERLLDSKSQKNASIKKDFKYKSLTETDINNLISNTGSGTLKKKVELFLKSFENKNSLLMIFEQKGVLDLRDIQISLKADLDNQNFESLQKMYIHTIGSEKFSNEDETRASDHKSEPKSESKNDISNDIESGTALSNVFNKIEISFELDNPNTVVSTSNFTFPKRGILVLEMQFNEQFLQPLNVLFIKNGLVFYDKEIFLAMRKETTDSSQVQENGNSEQDNSKDVKVIEDSSKSGNKSGTGKRQQNTGENVSQEKFNVYLYLLYAFVFLFSLALIGKSFILF